VEKNKPLERTGGRGEKKKKVFQSERTSELSGPIVAAAVIGKM